MIHADTWDGMIQRDRYTQTDIIWFMQTHEMVWYTRTDTHRGWDTETEMDWYIQQRWDDTDEVVLTDRRGIILHSGARYGYSLPTSLVHSVSFSLYMCVVESYHGKNRHDDVHACCFARCSVPSVCMCVCVYVSVGALQHYTVQGTSSTRARTCSGRFQCQHALAI